jgi:hypothetical protein
MSDLSPLSAVKRKLDFGAVRSVDDPFETSVGPTDAFLRPVKSASAAASGTVAALLFTITADLLWLH